MSTIPTIRPEVEVDTALAAVYATELTLARKINAAVNTIHFTAGDRPRSRSPYRLTLAEALAAVPTMPWEARDHAEAAAKLEKLRAERAVLLAERRSLEDRYTGWSRFFLVPGGHIHSSMNCSTCYPTTLFGWLPELSGLSEPEAVAEHGAILCTICFPSAPVEWTNQYDLEAAAKAAARCVGSGTWDYDRATARMGYYTGNAGTCEHCGARVTLTKTGKLRGHKDER